MEQSYGVAIIAGLFTLAGAAITVAYQIRESIKKRRQIQIDEKIERRMSIISDLVACRYVLTPNRADIHGVSRFNYALNKIPVEFIDSKEVIDKYRRIGDNFNSDRFHKLIIDMIRATREVPDHIDIDLLEKVPSVSPNKIVH